MRCSFLCDSLCSLSRRFSQIETDQKESKRLKTVTFILICVYLRKSAAQGTQRMHTENGISVYLNNSLVRESL